jgi:hypothetical protein
MVDAGLSLRPPACISPYGNEARVHLIMTIGHRAAVPQPRLLSLGQLVPGHHRAAAGQVWSLGFDQVRS